MKIITFVVSLMFVSGVLHADWTFNGLTDTTGTISEGSWTLNVAFDINTASLLTISSVGTAYANLDLSTGVDQGSKTIIAIGNSAFSNKTAITTVTLPNTLQSIGNSAFQNCSGITTITPFLPNTVASIGTYAFSGCSKLTSPLTLLNVNLTEIADYAFNRAALITSVDMRNTKVKTIGNSAFAGNGTDTGNLLGNNKIGYVILSDCLESISSDAFRYHISITNVTPFLPGNITNVGAYAFANCERLTSPLILSNKNLTQIPNDAFMKVFLTPSIDMSQSGVITIGANAFRGHETSGNNKVGSILLSPDLESIGSAAFGYHAAATNIAPFLPFSVTNIGVSAFESCSNVKGNLSLSNPNLTSIPNRAFYNNWNLSAVDMSSSGVKTIGTSAFEGYGSGTPSANNKLGRVIFSDYVESVGAYAFRTCSAITNLTPFLQSTITNIGAYAFGSCNSVKGDLRLSNPELKDIPTQAFYNACAIASVDMTGSKVKTIGTSAFEGWGTPASNNKIVNVVFSGCLESIASKAFISCAGITNITPFLPTSITNIGSEAFRTCSSLVTPLVINSEKHVAIANSAFNNTKSTSVLLGIGVTNLSATSIFAGSTTITNVWFGGNFPVFSESVFPAYSANLTARFYIPNGNTTWNKYVGEKIVYLSDQETNAYVSKYGVNAPLPLGKFIPSGSTTVYQYLCTWRPPPIDRLITVLVVQ